MYSNQFKTHWYLNDHSIFTQKFQTLKEVRKSQKEVGRIGKFDLSRMIFPERFAIEIINPETNKYHDKPILFQEWKNVLDANLLWHVLKEFQTGKFGSWKNNLSPPQCTTFQINECMKIASMAFALPQCSLIRSLLPIRTISMVSSTCLRVSKSPLWWLHTFLDELPGWKHELMAESILPRFTICIEEAALKWE